MNHFFRFIRIFIVLALLVSTILVAGIVYYMEFQLPDIDALNTVQLQVPLQIFTHDKKLIATFGENRRIPIPYNQIPKPLIQAVMATEDQRYFSHSGVDVPGLGRAAVQLVLTGRKLQGGSTITMQVARSFYLTRHKTFARKLREILLAIKIEHRLTKEKILELYLNKIFFGNRAYGVAAAAQIYYGKTLDKLTIDQYAMLAGLPKAPSALNPLADPEAAEKRRNHVLERMREQGYIDAATYETAIKAPLNASYHDLQTEVKAPYLAELVREQLEQMYGDSIYTDGFKVYTTLDSSLQAAANLALRNNLLAYDQRHGYRGATENLGIPSLDNMQEWEEILHKKPAINGLQPAAVVEMTAQTITVLRADGSLTIIPWQGLVWARKQVNADYLGPRPRRADQIVKLGDVVFVNASPQGYQLAQMPKAEAGLVALSPENGAILAMIGGFDYQVSKFNRITHARLQPGSSFKPFVYSAALEKGFTLATVINDAPIIIENTTDNSLWRPQNSTHKFYGPTRLRTAIIQSRNLVSIRLLAMMGMSYTVNYLKRFGFMPTQLPAGLSLALGTALVTPLQMAQAYAVFANGGLKIVPYAIDTIRNSQDEVIYQAKPLVACTSNCDENQAIAPRVLSEENAYLMNSALHDVIQLGTAKLAKNLGRNDLSGKTGTTNDQKDAWFAGYNPNIVAITWVGFDQPQSLHEYGAAAALPMWMDFIQAALKGKPENTPPQPTGVVSVRIDPTTGRRLPDKSRSGMSEYFMEPYLPDVDDGSSPETADAADKENFRPDPSGNASDPSSSANNGDDGNATTAATNNDGNNDVNGNTVEQNSAANSGSDRNDASKQASSDAVNDSDMHLHTEASDEANGNSHHASNDQNSDLGTPDKPKPGSDDEMAGDSQF